jgi:hypothetical protein
MEIPPTKQAAIRQAFKDAGAPKDAAERFLETMPALLGSLEQVAREHGADQAVFKALHRDTKAKKHLRRAVEYLDAALVELAAVKHFPATMGNPMTLHVEDEAIRRVRRKLDFLRGYFQRPGLPGTEADHFEQLALDAIASVFDREGLPLVTTPGGLFPTVARVVLKRWDKDVQPRKLLSAIRWVEQLPAGARGRIFTIRALSRPKPQGS